LEFFDYVGDSYKVSICGSYCQGRASVYALEVARLGEFFRDLALHWSGWNGEKQWQSIEGEVSLTAKTDRTGHVDFLVHMRSGPYPYDWRLTTTLLVEAGQLEHIAAQVERFISR
jgi:hypothetical protein